MELSPSCQREASDMYKFYTRSRYLELKKKKKNHKNLFSNFYTLNLFLLSRVKLFVKVKTRKQWRQDRTQSFSSNYVRVTTICLSKSILRDLIFY